MNYQELKRAYVKYKDYLVKNADKYAFSREIVSRGITEGQGLSVGTLDDIYRKADMFVTEYETFVELIRGLEDMGIHYVVRSSVN